MLLEKEQESDLLDIKDATLKDVKNQDKETSLDQAMQVVLANDKQDTGLNKKEDPKFDKWFSTPRVELDPSRQRDHGGNIMHNVHFYNCAELELDLINCHWENVLISDCNFRKTTFRNVKLVNTVLAHLDLDNVTVFNLSEQRYFWRMLIIHNAVINTQSISLASCTRGEKRVMYKPQHSSRTVAELVPEDSLSPLQKQNISEGSGECNREICMIAHRTPPQLMDILKQQSIKDRIMQFCFPGDVIQIYEYPGGWHNRTYLQRLHTYYRVEDRNTADAKSSVHETSYFSSQWSSDSEVVKQHPHPRSKGVSFYGFATGLLRANKSLSKMASESLYGRTFRFKCSPEGAKMFLRLHKEHAKSIKELELYFHFKTELGSIQTGDESWHELMCLIRHELAFIPSIHVHIGQDFWKKARWKQARLSERPNIVIGQSDLRNSVDPDHLRPSFLYEIAKIAAPAERWLDHLDPKTKRTDGTRLQISIQETTDDLKKQFIEILHSEIERRRTARPLFLNRKTYKRTVEG